MSGTTDLTHRAVLHSQAKVGNNEPLPVCSDNKHSTTSPHRAVHRANFEGIPVDDTLFAQIRKLCEHDEPIHNVNITPQCFEAHRLSSWPTINEHGMGSLLSKIYNEVRHTGLPNCLAAKHPLPSGLNLPIWERELSKHGADYELLSFIKYGFPLGYVGPISNTKDTPNHKSALSFYDDVNKFITKEIQLGGIVGPMPHPPFKEWVHTSPLMTREKKDSSSRRVIIDMTYPNDTSVNAYIYKNTVLGNIRDHKLPSVDDVVELVTGMGPQAHMATTDISRAYKNFSSCPLDWPLLAFKWNQEYYCDVTMPFGARSSSCHMQRVADAIVHMLGQRGVTARIYLDDVIVVSPDHESCVRDFACVQSLLEDLGLPESVEKVQAPSQCVKWLGVLINVANMSLSLPEDKVDQILVCVNKALACRSLSKRHLQSLLGKLIHMGKCVKPARLFIARLLEALRGMTRNFIKINTDMRNDLKWFQEFASGWNGISLIPSSTPDKHIIVDASGSGIGGYDEHCAYGGRITPVGDPVANISELEAVNVVVALQTFLSPADRGRHILVKCDNLSSVEVFRSGRGRNRLILECARHLWMLQAVLDIKLSYEHIAGKDNLIADSLSRLHISKVYRDRAQEFMSNNNITYVTPCLYVFTHLLPSLISRTGIRVSPTQSCSETNEI